MKMYHKDQEFVLNCKSIKSKFRSIIMEINCVSQIKVNKKKEKMRLQMMIDTFIQMWRASSEAKINQMHNNEEAKEE